MLTLLEPDHSQCCLNRTGYKTRVACVLTSVLVHLFRGSLSVAEGYNETYHYPNAGSLAFVLATSLYAMTLCLHPKSLCIRSSAVQSVFKVLLVLIISNILLVAVWQQLVNLTVEVVLLFHDILHFFDLPAAFLIDNLVSYYLGHVEAFVILAWVLRNLVSSEDSEQEDLSFQDTSTVELSSLDERLPSLSSGSEGTWYDTYFLRSNDASDVSSREYLMYNDSDSGL